MNKEEKLELLDTYIKTNVAPILLEDVTSDVFKKYAVILDAHCDISLLNGHYEETEFMPPKWYEQIFKKRNEKNNILLIDRIFELNEKEQLKFGKIIKYRKVGEFELPKNCLIIIVCPKKEIGKINKELYSYVAHV